MKSIFMRNKKGEEGDPTKAIVGAVIAAAVLVIVLVGVYFFVSGKAIPFFEFLPSFNQTKPGVTDTEIFGYDIRSDKLQYYDGTRWVPCEPKNFVDMNRKIVDCSKSKQLFVDYYYGNADNTLRYIVYSPSWTEGIIFTEAKDIKGMVVKKISLEKADYYGVDLDDKEYFFKGDKPVGRPSEIDPTNLKVLLLEWRASFVNKPVEVTYYKKAGDTQGTSVRLCPDRERYDVDKIIVVRLNNPTTGDSCAEA